MMYDSHHGIPYQSPGHRASQPDSAILFDLPGPPWRKPWSWKRVRRSIGWSRIATIWFYAVCAKRQAGWGGESMGSEQAMLPGWESAQESYGPTGGAASESEEGERARKPRFEPIEREQLFWRKVDVERLIGE